LTSTRNNIAFTKKICMSKNNRVWSIKQDDSRIPLK